MDKMIVLLALCVAAAGAAAQTPAGQEDRMEEFREAKFGMFIHWGIYSIPARGEWVMNREKIPVAEYPRFAARFNPVKFDANQWVRIARDAVVSVLCLEHERN